MKFAAKYVVVCVVLVLSFVSVVAAQLPTGTILGVVKDASGAAVPGATMTAINADTNATRTGTTEEDGSYRFDGLPVGNYQVKAEKTGFGTVENTLTLTVAQQATVNFSLAVGAVSQTITATTEAILVNTTQSSLGGLVDSQRMVDLPLNGRNYNDLTLMQPGVTQLTATNTTVLGQAGTLFSSNGAPTRSNSYLLDGANMANYVGTSGGSAMGTTLGVDGILEYRVITNGIPAEYGGSMGSQMVMVSKSGTNQFHGSGFEFLRNSALDARNFFDLQPSVLGRRLPEFRRNNFGGSFGGPIQKDKTFFFATYEGLRQTLGLTNTTVVPALTCHGNNGGPYDVPGSQIYNGSTGSGTTQPLGSVGSCTQLGGSTAAATTLSPIAAPWMALYPHPNIGNPLTSTLYGYTYPQPTAENYGQMRVDHTFNEKDSLFVRYTIDDSSQVSPYNFYVPNNINQVLQTVGSRDQFLTLGESHVFSSVLLNTARFSFSRTNFRQDNSTTIPNGPGNPYSLGAGTNAGFPNGMLMGSIAPGGLQALGTNTLAPKKGKRNLFAWSDDVNYTQGKHSFKFGVLVDHYQDYIHSEGMDKVSASFSGLSTMMTALTSSLTYIPPSSLFDRWIHYNTFGIYVQDDYRATQRLTLNLGVRYEPMTDPTEVHGFQANFRNLQTDQNTTVGPYFKNPSLHNIGPHVGFAWDVAGDGKTAIRGSFVESYDLATYGSTFNNSTQYDPPFSTLYTVVGQTIGAVPFPCPSTQSTFCTAAALPSYRGPVYNMRQPHMLMYNLAIERQLPGNMALTVAYVGSRGIDLLQYKEGNPALPNGIPVTSGTTTTCVAQPAGSYINDASQIDGSATSCWVGAVQHNVPAANGNPAVVNCPSNTNPCRVNPWIDTLQVDPASGDSHYNALQVGLAKRLSHGLQLQSWYTYGKSLDDTGDAQGGDEGGQNASAGQDALHQATQRGPSNFDVNHNWRLNGIYNLPNFVKDNGFASKLANGWWTSGILSVQSGYPFDARISGNRSADGLFGSGQDSMSVVPGRTPYNITHGVSSCTTGSLVGHQLGTPSLWYDPCAFALPPAGELGNQGRNDLRGPGYFSLNLSLVKDTAIAALGEAGKLEFRVETFNLLNRANFTTPFGTAYQSNGTLLGTAGVITSTNGPSRQIQFGVRLMF